MYPMPTTRAPRAETVTARVRHHLALSDPPGRGMFIESLKQPRLGGLQINAGERANLVEIENVLWIRPLPTMIGPSFTPCSFASYSYFLFLLRYRSSYGSRHSVGGSCGEDAVVNSSSRAGVRRPLGQRSTPRRRRRLHGSLAEMQRSDLRVAVRYSRATPIASTAFRNANGSPRPTASNASRRVITTLSRGSS
jgi:hypothetical protein